MERQERITRQGCPARQGGSYVKADFGGCTRLVMELVLFLQIQPEEFGDSKVALRAVLPPASILIYHERLRFLVRLIQSCQPV